MVLLLHNRQRMTQRLRPFCKILATLNDRRRAAKADGRIAFTVNRDGRQGYTVAASPDEYAMIDRADILTPRRAIFASQTNLFDEPYTFDQWDQADAGNAATVTPNDLASPESGHHADKIELAANAASGIKLTVNITATGTYRMRVLIYSASAQSIRFSDGTPQAVALAAGWNLCDISFVIAATGNTDFSIINSDGTAREIWIDRAWLVKQGPFIGGVDADQMAGGGITYESGWTASNITADDDGGINGTVVRVGEATTRLTASAPGGTISDNTTFTAYKKNAYDLVFSVAKKASGDSRFDARFTDGTNYLRGRLDVVAGTIRVDASGWEAIASNVTDRGTFWECMIRGVPAADRAGTYVRLSVPMIAATAPYGNPTAAWGFDDDNTFEDVSGNGNDGTPTGVRLGENGEIICDAVGDYVEIPHDNSLVLDGSFSVYGWIYRGVGGDTRFFTKGNGSTASITEYIFSGDGSNTLFIRGAWRSSGTSLFTTKAWSFMSFTYDDTTKALKFFKNAEQIGSTIDLTGASYATTTNLAAFINKQGTITTQGGPAKFAGITVEKGIARTQPELMAIYRQGVPDSLVHDIDVAYAPKLRSLSDLAQGEKTNPTPTLPSLSGSLVSQWNFDAAEPADEIGSNDLSGTNITAADVVAGLLGDAIDYDGATEYHHSDSDDFDFGTGTDFGFVALITPGSGDARILCNRADDDHGYQLYWDGSGSLQFVVSVGSGGENKHTVSLNGLSVGETYLVIAGYTHATTTPVMLVNLTPTNGTSGPWSLGSSGTRLYIGCRADVDDHYNGEIELLGMYDADPTGSADEILAAVLGYDDTDIWPVLTYPQSIADSHSQYTCPDTDVDAAVSGAAGDAWIIAGVIERDHDTGAGSVTDPVIVEWCDGSADGVMIKLDEQGAAAYAWMCTVAAGVPSDLAPVSIPDAILSSGQPIAVVGYGSANGGGIAVATAGKHTSGTISGDRSLPAAVDDLRIGRDDADANYIDANVPVFGAWSGREITQAQAERLARELYEAALIHAE